MFCCLFYGIIDWILKDVPVRNGKGVKLVGIRAQWEVVASVHVHRMGEGVTCLPFWFVCTNLITPLVKLHLQCI